MTPILLALLVQAAPAPVCTATVAPPAGLEAWTMVSAIAKAPIPLGRAAALTLDPVAGVTFAPPPSRAAKPGSFGGVYTFTVATAGTYRVALGSGAWIDVVRDGKALTSTAHTEGPACSGIRKVVDFVLTPGRYTLQLSGSKEAPMRVLIVPK